MQSSVSNVNSSLTLQAVAVRGNFEQSQMAQQRVREVIWKAKEEMARGYVCGLVPQYPGLTPLPVL